MSFALVRDGAFADEGEEFSFAEVLEGTEALLARRHEDYYRDVDVVVGYWVSLYAEEASVLSGSTLLPEDVVSVGFRRVLSAVLREAGGDVALARLMLVRQMVRRLGRILGGDCENYMGGVRFGVDVFLEDVDAFSPSAVGFGFYGGLLRAAAALGLKYNGEGGIPTIFEEVMYRCLDGVGLSASEGYSCVLDVGNSRERIGEFLSGAVRSCDEELSFYREPGFGDLATYYAVLRGVASGDDGDLYVDWVRERCGGVSGFERVMARAFDRVGRLGYEWHDRFVQV